jgi:hypothetical protein
MRQSGNKGFDDSLPYHRQACKKLEGGYHTTFTQPAPNGVNQRAATTHHHHQSATMTKIKSVAPTAANAGLIHKRREEGATWDDILADYGLHSERAKEILTRHGFDHSPAGSARVLTEKWDRPCLKCGSKELRTRGLFRCKSCRHDGRTIYNAVDCMFPASFKSGS